MKKKKKRKHEKKQNRRSSEREEPLGFDYEKAMEMADIIVFAMRVALVMSWYIEERERMLQGFDASGAADSGLDEEAMDDLSVFDDAVFYGDDDGRYEEISEDAVHPESARQRRTIYADCDFRCNGYCGVRPRHM